MKRQRLLELAGVRLTEMEGGDNLQQLTHAIFKMAEEEVYNNSEEGGLNVTSDQILQVAQSIIKTLEDGVSDLIYQEFQNK